MVEAVKRGFPQREIADAAYDLQRQIDRGERIVVGVNDYREGGDAELEILRIDPALERKQIGRVQAVRARRDSEPVERALAELKATAADDDRNLMPNLLACARVHASEGEIVEALQEVFGTYTETPVFDDDATTADCPHPRPRAGRPGGAATRTSRSATTTSSAPATRRP